MVQPFNTTSWVQVLALIYDYLDLPYHVVLLDVFFYLDRKFFFGILLFMFYVANENTE